MPCTNRALSPQGSATTTETTHNGHRCGSCKTCGMGSFQRNAFLKSLISLCTVILPTTPVPIELQMAYKGGMLHTTPLMLTHYTQEHYSYVDPSSVSNVLNPRRSLPDNFCGIYQDCNSTWGGIFGPYGYICCAAASLYMLSGA